MIKIQFRVANFNPLQKEEKKEGRKRRRKKKGKKGGTEEESWSIKYDHLSVLVK